MCEQYIIYEQWSFPAWPHREDIPITPKYCFMCKDMATSLISATFFHSHLAQRSQSGTVIWHPRDQKLEHCGLGRGFPTKSLLSLWTLDYDIVL